MSNICIISEIKSALDRIAEEIRKELKEVRFLRNL